MKCRGGWRDQPDPNLMKLGGSERERAEVDVAAT